MTQVQFKRRKLGQGSFANTRDTTPVNRRGMDLNALIYEFSHLIFHNPTVVRRLNPKPAPKRSRKQSRNEEWSGKTADCQAGGRGQLLLATACKCRLHPSKTNSNNPRHLVECSILCIVYSGHNRPARVKNTCWTLIHSRCGGPRLRALQVELRPQQKLHWNRG